MKPSMAHRKLNDTENDESVSLFKDSAKEAYSSVNYVTSRLGAFDNNIILEEEIDLVSSK